MRYSNIFAKTSKTTTSDDSMNAKLLTQGGFILKQMAGVYNFLPLGLRVLQKIQNIIREEMNALGANEVLMPALTQEESYVKTGRENIDVLFKLKGHNDAKYVLNQSHEEVITPMVQKHCFSYRDLPVGVYQIQNKFRNEPRAKSGILRGREFNMKDLYSFHIHEQDLEEYYERAKEAYVKVYERLGLGEKTVLTFASGGSFSKYSHEFQTLSDVGEDLIFYAEKQDIYYNREIAPSNAPAVKYDDAEMLPMEDVLGEGLIGVDALAEYLKIPVEKTTKTLLYETETGEVIAAAVRGQYQINELKLLEVVGCKELKLASEETVRRVTGAKVGYAGMLNLPKEVRQVWDESTQGRLNFEMGANKTDYHSMNVNFGRDVEEPKEFYDIKIAQEGDLEPDTDREYKTYKSIEVGNIFKLSTRFADAFGFKYVDENGKEQPVYMGCYGIGPSRVMGTIVEVFHDDRGIVWPEAVAPFHVHLLTIGTDQEVLDTAEKLYQELQEKGIEVLYDDRDAGAGQKLGDADLIGNPIRIVVSPKTLKEGSVEMKRRNEEDSHLIKMEAVLDELLQ